MCAALIINTELVSVFLVQSIIIQFVPPRIHLVSSGPKNLSTNPLRCPQEVINLFLNLGRSRLG